MPGHATTTIPATSQPSPAATVIAADGEAGTAVSSITPVTRNAAATSAASTDNEANGRSTSTTPAATHARPRITAPHRGKRRKTARPARMTSSLRVRVPSGPAASGHGGAAEHHPIHRGTRATQPARQANGARWRSPPKHHSPLSPGMKANCWSITEAGRFSIHVRADGAFRPWSGAEAGAWY
jgi:hypothetical protein